MWDMNARRVLPALFVALAGCAAQPVTEIQRPVLPDQWQRVQADDAQVALPAGTTDWWARFGAPELAEVVRQALDHNQNVAAAAARLEQAWAWARIAGASRWPEVSADLDASRQGRLGGHPETVGTNYGLGLTASYEVDFWGRLHAERQAVVQTARASGLDAHTVAVTVSAETAAAWIDTQSLRQRIGIAASDLDRAERLAALIRARVEAGLETPLALAQQETLLANQRADLALLGQQAAQAQALLALWMGRADDSGLSGADIQTLRVPTVHAGLPSDLLVRRPDIAAAEARLRAADADVVAARAAMFPRLTLATTVGGTDSSLSGVLDNPVYSLAAGLLAPIFQGGRLAAGHELAQAQRKELLAHYRQAILHGFMEVQQALDAVAGTQAQVSAQQQAQRQAERAMSLAEARYREGADTVLTLLDVQRELYVARDAAVQRQADQLRASVSLYRALGGGWDAGEQT